MINITPRAAALLLALAALLGGCSKSEPQPAARIVLVQPAAMAASTGGVYTGEIRARHEVDLAFRVGGRIAARLVDVGAEIRTGQALARLDPADLELAAAAARAQLAAAESEHATARAERARYADLIARKFVSQAAFEAKDNAYNSALARLDQARSQSRMSGNQAAYGTLSSEFPAIVTSVLADAGQVVGAGQAVMRVARPEEKEVAIAIPESRLVELKTAKNLAVSLWADPKITLPGELRELSPAADPATRTYAARIRILNPTPDVRLGMTARVALDGAVESVLLVPLGAVIDAGQGPLVRVVEDGKVVSRPVKVARFREDGVELSSGLAAGEQVIISGAGRLVDGQEVQAKAATTPDRQR
ncbi:MAG: efflux RND transporter periplasmic adaptor subunit [Gammaproteobacteria bacterium]|nr:efflux RND transporter periplasmic adaptor subunit [Gammaproteobacteria bacterium]MBU1602389.1 efflux RND transporter periplasmic adaptor subunit [Gammaproteobacteria bacterium]MBU2433194.1 efflux RND transporter periplasmic adaptor subunit [Gammaproteobacteria bacterium]MBU2451110.1 efflux RND transporter periplasmic adaptor subunit [Gammaproteobacteria bacterium]